MELKDHLKKIAIPAKKPYVEKLHTFRCELCNDVGFVRVEVEISHPLFGKLVPCPCKQGTEVTTQADDSGLYPGDRALSWKDVINNDETIWRARQAVAQTLSRGYGWVYLWGGYGTAKTTILKTAIAESLRAGTHAMYARMSDILDEIRSGYDAKNPQGEAIRRLKALSGIPVLAIDELEKTNETGFAVEKRFQLFDNRYSMAISQKRGVTIIAGNIDPARMGGAIGSRINDERFTVVHITAKDMRQIGREFHA